MDLFDIAVARKLSGGSGGGGGSSDFSTATVTVNNSSGSVPFGQLYGAIVDSAELGYEFGSVVSSSELELSNTSPITATAVLYRGYAYLVIFAVLASDITLSGSATKEIFGDNDGTIITITGDCTITIS